MNEAGDLAIDWKRAKESLSHVFWISGASAAGKSTISKKVASDFSMIHYSQDAQTSEHVSRATEEKYPVMHAAQIQTVMLYNRHLLQQPPDTIEEMWREISRERLSMSVEDLLALPDDKPILAEVFCGGVIDEMYQMIERGKAVFLVSTKAFHKAEYLRRFRGQEGAKDFKRHRQSLENCPDPEAVFMSGYVQYHLNINQYTRDECRKRNLPLLITGGQSSLEESYKAVCDHFHLSRHSE